ncbi:Ig-like domain repeat protein [Nocardioides sp. Soil805]|uniref:Ig-like domain repeat protein n=1 Tax=Nocardioides sp. Soil805 TaxID=1736416 RepID=UPI000A9FB1AD|nr:Ig-like domain repeat protein [Nocardioides sp. Soil805]
MSRTTAARRATARASALMVLAAAAVLAVPSGSYAVAPGAPSGLNVAQPLPSTTKFNWNRSAGADKYEIQVDDDPGFGTPEVSAATVNSVYVPEVALKLATNYWRVRAVQGTDRSDWATGLPFDPPQVGVPVPSSPVDGAHLQQPDNAPLLSWTASPGAKSYTVQVASDSDFVGATEFTTETTSLVVTRPLGLGDWFWRVIASKGPGIVSQPSTTSTFWIDPLATPVITGPLGPQANVSPDVIDVVLDWNPVAGAIGYELQVSTNSDFTAGSVLEDRTGASNRVLGTRFSPAITYDNNGYYWRVRAVDTAGNSSQWARSSVDFNRHYDISPDLVFPANGATTVPDPLYFQWDAVTNASEYEIWVGTDAEFSPNTYNSCRVAATTYTPGIFAINDTDLINVLPNRINEDCDPEPGKVNYWRVRPLDRPYVKPGGGDLPGVQGLWSPTWSFTYTGLAMTNLLPVNGATVAVPTLSWDSAPGALTYKVTITNGLGQVVDSETTYATSYTPKGQTRLPAANNPYTWSVYAVTGEGTTSLAPQRRFNVAASIPATGAAPLTPLGPSPATQFNGPPSLSWEHEPTAAYYRVHALKPGTNILVTSGLFEKPVAFPAMTDISSELKRAGTYTWWVTAHSSTGAQIGGAGPTSTFQIRAIAPATGHKVALGGRALDANNPGQTPCTPTTGVCTVPATPVLRWSREPGTAFYMVYVSEDPSFSNLLEPTTALPATTNTIYMPALDNRDWTYADNQTERPYYWFVRPCRAVGQCGASPVGVSGSAQHTFFKKSPPVSGLRSSLTQKTEATFTWDNYWHDPASTATTDTWAQTGESLPQSAMKYRIEVATDSSFSPSTVIDSAEVDQATFTSTAKIYANRTYWWRVQAIDSDGNGLTWSTSEATFVRETPPVTLLAPVNSVAAAGTTAFRWQAQPYAKGYDVEVYKNDDLTYSAANKVASGTGLLTTAYTWNKALAPSASAYRWRVRRVDASGNPGDWSAGGRFFVTAGTPTITAPGTGAIQPPDGPVLEWDPIPTAALYTVTVTPVSGGSTVVANTVSTAWAATSRFTSGDYRWTLAAKDASGNVLGTASSVFTVNAVLVADAKPAILAPGGTGVGSTLTVQAPTWAGGHTDVTVTYQWLRDGQPIYGAAPSSGTGTSYVVQALDYGKTITVKATGTKPNYASGTSVSDGLVVSAGGALVSTTLPVISGSPVVGSTLQVSPGTWSPTQLSLTYQWLRNGALIPSATRSSYRLVPEDAGTSIAVVVLAARTGYSDGGATAVAVSVPKMASKTTATLSKTRVPVGKRVKIGITVAVAGVAGPTGAIKVFDGAKKLKTLTLVSTRDGKIGWKLPKLKKGKHKIKAVYIGNGSTAGSKSKITKLYVVR